MTSASFRPQSSHIFQVDWDSGTDTLTIEFADGRSYDYLNVPGQVFRDFQSAPSAGQYFNRQIRQRFAAEER